MSAVKRGAEEGPRFASLTSGLLARKGSAKPAMRPQLYRFADPLQEDDLGWNDLGEDDLPPSEHDYDANAVLNAQEAIAEAFMPEPQGKDYTAGVASRAAPGSKGKSAFTLRLAGERHLRLRLACALRHRSAQSIVTEALDQFLAGMPEIDAAVRVQDARS